MAEKVQENYPADKGAMHVMIFSMPNIWLSNLSQKKSFEGFL